MAEATGERATVESVAARAPHAGWGAADSDPHRQLRLDYWWKNGGAYTRNGITRLVEPIIDRQPARAETRRYLSEDERRTIADGARAGKSARKIAVARCRR